MSPTIRISEESYQRLGKYSHGFKTPAEVIAEMLDFYEQANGSDKVVNDSLVPDDGAIRPCSPLLDNPIDDSPYRLPPIQDCRPSYWPGASSVPDKATSIEIVYHPDNDVGRFKQLLLKHRRADVKLSKTDGTSEIHVWNAGRFTEKSDVENNLRSGYLRGWRTKGICKAELSINKDDLR